MKKLRAIVASLIFLAALAMPNTVRADVNDFVINDFKGRYELFNDIHGGRMAVTETINLTFSDQNHGILRAIPTTYKDQSLRLDVRSIKRDGLDEPYSTYDENDNEVLKIGDAGKTITGIHTYEITYEMQGIITFYENHDEWYWDINGDDWDQPFLAVNGEVVFPAGWTDAGVPASVCYTGSFGATSQECSLEKTDRGYKFEATKSLESNQTLTIVAAAPKGLFTPRDGGDWWRENYARVIGGILPPLLIGSWAYRKWRKNGKDLPGRGTIIPEYGPPRGLSPAEAAVINNYGLSARDISATIIDLAIRKYIRIIEITKKRILKDKTSYEFELLNFDWSGLKSHEVQILKDIFPEAKNGQKTELDSLKNKFYKTIQSLQTSMPKDLAGAGYFPSNPRLAGAGMYVLGVVLVVLGFIFFAIMPIGLLLSGVIVLIFASLMRKRTEQGVAAREAILGLKMYMDTAEKDRIKMLQSPDAPYAVKSAEPKKTVELFEKLLPYAVVLGVENGWAEQFKDIYRTPPDWYSGNWTAFNSVYLANSLTNSVSAMGTNFSAPSSSSGSGFGGGGSSGGGGGGGGGGGW